MSRATKSKEKLKDKEERSMKQRRAKSARRFKLPETAERAFNILDRNGDEKVSVKELEFGSRLLGYNPTREEAEQMIRDCNPAEEGYLTRKEFLTFFNNHRTDLDTQMQELKQAFKVLDKDNSGYISVKELRFLMQNSGEKMEESEVSELISLVDRDNNGQLDLEEFVFLLCELDSMEGDDVDDENDDIGDVFGEDLEGQGLM